MASEQVLERDDWIYEQTEEDDDAKGVVVPYQISFFPADFTLAGYHEKKKSTQLRLPPFQRNYVWDVTKASRLIESFLLGLPVPGVFLYKERKTNRLQVIDGQQRITSAVRFFDGAFDERVFRLKGVADKWNGKTFEELDEADQFQLKDTVLRATIVQQLDPEDDSSIYHVFERLNTGGVNLNPMEVRKCVYYGRYLQLLEELNDYASWREILGKNVVDKRLRDVELVLRVMAFAYDGETYEKPMKQFLNRHMAAARKMSDASLDQRIEGARARFHRVTDAVVQALGNRPFHLRQRLNYAVTDAVLGVLLAADGVNTEKLKAEYEALISDEAFIEAVSVSTSDDRQVKIRHDAARRLLVG